MPNIEQTLSERGAQYGSFDTHAGLTQNLEETFWEHYEKYSPDHDNRYGVMAYIHEGLHMIFHKLGRLGNGNIRHIDSWVDIAGYATLVAKLLQESEDFDRELERTGKQANQ